MLRRNLPQPHLAGAGDRPRQQARVGQPPPQLASQGPAVVALQGRLDGVHADDAQEGAPRELVGRRQRGAGLLEARRHPIVRRRKSAPGRAFLLLCGPAETRCTPRPPAQLVGGRRVEKGENEERAARQTIGPPGWRKPAECVFAPPASANLDAWRATHAGSFARVAHPRFSVSFTLSAIAAANGCFTERALPSQVAWRGAALQPFA